MISSTITNITGSDIESMVDNEITEEDKNNLLNAPDDIFEKLSVKNYLTKNNLKEIVIIYGLVDPNLDYNGQKEHMNLAVLCDYSIPDVKKFMGNCWCWCETHKDETRENWGKGLKIVYDLIKILRQSKPENLPNLDDKEVLKEIIKQRIFLKIF